MTDYVEIVDDIVDSWEDTAEEFDDMEFLTVPDMIAEEGNDAVDNYIHQKFVKQMSENRYNGD